MFKSVVSLVCLLFAASAVAQGRSSDYQEDYHRQALEIFRHIISLRTAAGHGKVPEMADYLADQFRDAGLDDEDIHLIPQVISSGEQVASLVVRYRGNGLSGKKPILLLAHMDVVDAIRSDWVREPYELIEEGGLHLGRPGFSAKHAHLERQAAQVDALFCRHFRQQEGIGTPQPNSSTSSLGCRRASIPRRASRPAKPDSTARMSSSSPSQPEMRVPNWDMTSS